MKRKSSPRVAVNVRRSPRKKTKNHIVINIPPSPPKTIPARRMLGGNLNNTLKKLSSSPRPSPPKPMVRRSPRRFSAKSPLGSPAKPILPLSKRQIDNISFAPYAINF